VLIAGLARLHLLLLVPIAGLSSISVFMAMSLAIFFRFVFVLALAFTVLDVGDAPLVSSVDGSG